MPTRNGSLLASSPNATAGVGVTTIRGSPNANNDGKNGNDERLRMYEEAAMQDEPTRSKDEPLIHRHMRNLRKRAELLREQADILEGRLAPILGPNVQDVNKQAPALVAPEASDLARDLDGMHDTLSNVYGQVQRVLARLEI